MILGRWSLNQVYRRVVCVVLVAQGSLFVSFSIPFFVSSFYPSFQFASHPQLVICIFLSLPQFPFFLSPLFSPLFSLFLQSHSQYNLTLFLSFFFSTIRHSLFFLLILLFSLFFQFHSPPSFFLLLPFFLLFQYLRTSLIHFLILSFTCVPFISHTLSIKRTFKYSSNSPSSYKFSRSWTCPQV